MAHQCDRLCCCCCRLPNLARGAAAAPCQGHRQPGGRAQAWYCCCCCWLHACSPRLAGWTCRWQLPNKEGGIPRGTPRARRDTRQPGAREGRPLDSSRKYELPEKAVAKKSDLAHCFGWWILASGSVKERKALAVKLRFWICWKLALGFSVKKVGLIWMLSRCWVCLCDVLSCNSRNHLSGSHELTG